MTQRISRRGDRLRRVIAATLLLGTSAAAYAGCTSQPTEIVAGVTTQLQVPKFLQSVGVVVQLGGQLIFCRSYDVVDGTVTLPSTIGVVPQEEGPTDPVTVQILGFRHHAPAFENDCVAGIPDVGDQEVFVVRRQRMPYVEDRILYLPMPLRDSCSGVVCEDDETCVGSLCEPMDVDPTELEDYRDSFVFGNSNTCFDTGICMDEDTLVPAYLVDESDCTFRAAWPDDAPAPAEGNLNVRVVYDSFSTEILDVDDKEGFVLPDPSDPLTFRLASNMCQGAYANGRIIALQASPLCPAKTPLQPICAEDLAEIIEGRTNVAGSQVNLCAQGTSLSQTESALYVLMDRSDAMGASFGPDGLSFAVETPLENTIAARTRVAFDTLPAAASDCTTMGAGYTTPTIGFDVVSEVREPIGAFLGDTANVLPNDPDLNLEGALMGAYQALAGLTPTVSQQFNRRAVILVTNRQLEGSCNLGPGQSPADLAAAAFGNNAPIHTYVIALDAPAGTANVGDPVTAGAAIANAGGTELFDAINDEAAGAKAVQEVINDLGSCLYDAPLPGVFDNDVIPDDANLSYLNPVSAVRTDIPKNDACTEGSTASGWNQAGPDQPVRICGQACEDLRTMLDDVSLTYAVLGEPAPRIPIQVTLPCAAQ